MTKNQKMVLGLVTGIFLILVVAGIGAVMALRSVINSGATAGPDQMFGDQPLKTAVALIELHKVCYGHYPASGLVRNDRDGLSEQKSISL